MDRVGISQLGVSKIAQGPGLPAQFVILPEWQYCSVMMLRVWPDGLIRVQS